MTGTSNSALARSPRPKNPLLTVGALTLLTLTIGGCAEDLPALEDLDASNEAEVMTFIQAHRIAAELPGLSACIVKDGAVAWCGASGFAHIKENRRATPDTPFLLASVSKLVTATSAMQAVEAGLVELDQPIAEALSFEAAHPGGAPLTLRQLLSHTASVEDADVMDDFYYDDRDPTMSLRAVTEGYFDPEGRFYSARDNFLSAPPGTTYNYSNMGYALIGHLVEEVQATPFDEQTRRDIFDPLGMNHTAWNRGALDLSQVAMPYDTSGPRLRALGHYTFADYPNGGLRSSARDMARFLAAMTSGGSLEGERVLSEATLESMLRVVDSELDPEQGLGWLRMEYDDGVYWGHSGGEAGVYTNLLFRERDGLGFVLLCNGEGSQDHLDDIEAALMRFGDEGL